MGLRLQRFTILGLLMAIAVIAGVLRSPIRGGSSRSRCLSPVCRFFTAGGSMPMA